MKPTALQRRINERLEYTRQLKIAHRRADGSQPVIQHNLSEERLQIVYFMQGQLTGLIKIGHTTRSSLVLRITQCQTGSPDILRLIGIVDYPDSIEYNELYIQQLFNSFRVQGEWFRPNPELIDFIKRFYITQNCLAFLSLKQLERLERFVAEPQLKGKDVEIVMKYLPA